MAQLVLRIYNYKCKTYGADPLISPIRKNPDAYPGFYGQVFSSAPPIFGPKVSNKKTGTTYQALNARMYTF